MKHSYLYVLCLALLWGCGGNAPKETASKTSTAKDTITTRLPDPEAEGKAESASFNEEKAQTVLTGYFAKYGERNFGALKDYYTPEVKQFISMKKIPASQISKIARDFFKGKTNINYIPDFSRMEAEAQEDGFVVSLPLEMVWSENPNEQDYAQGTTYKSRSASVMLELEMNPKYKITAYREKTIIRPQYRLLEELTAEGITDAGTQMTLKKGTIVIDDFEKQFGEGVGSQIRVRYKGKAYWIPEYREGFGRGGDRLIERVE